MEHERAAERLREALRALDFPGVRVSPFMEYVSIEGAVRSSERVSRGFSCVPWVRLRCYHEDRNVDIHNPVELWDMMAFPDRVARNLIRTFQTTDAETSEELRFRLGIHDLDVQDGGRGYRRTTYMSGGVRLMPEPLLFRETISLDTARRQLHGRALAESGIGRYF